MHVNYISIKHKWKICYTSILTERFNTFHTIWTFTHFKRISLKLPFIWQNYSFCICSLKVVMYVIPSVVLAFPLYNQVNKIRVRVRISKFVGNEGVWLTSSYNQESTLSISYLVIQDSSHIHFYFPSTKKNGILIGKTVTQLNFVF